jgi:hypothetical protein
LLLAASNMVIPPQSSCQGDYGQQGEPKVKDLLAMELAGFNRGKNIIVGSCKGVGLKSCDLLISHQYGEDGNAARIQFTVLRGVVDMSTVVCRITP